MHLCLDTLYVIHKEYGTTYYPQPCERLVNVSIAIICSFLHIEEWGFVSKTHNETPNIFFHHGYFFELSGALQSMTINSILYNDVYVPSVDSTTIAPDDRNSVPWKIAYSKSRGFIRFYMVNGQTWIKL